MQTFDVYSYGVVSASTLYILDGAFPSPQGYAEISRTQRMTGGEAANSSIVLARLGASVRFDGNWLGNDADGQGTRKLLEEHEVDTSRLTLKDGYPSVREVVFTTGGTRTIFGTYGRLQQDAAWNSPQDEDIRSARIICLDPFFGDASSRVAEVGHDAGIPVVTVDCPLDVSLLGHCSAVVIAESFTREKYPGRQLDTLFRDYQGATDGLVVFTFGDDAIWYARQGEPLRYFQPYAIEAVDTTGGGDAFRAGIVYGLLQEWDDERTVDFAAATAALVCARSPGVLDSPTFAEVTRFMLESDKPESSDLDPNSMPES